MRAKELILKYPDLLNWKKLSCNGKDYRCDESLSFSVNGKLCGEVTYKKNKKNHTLGFSEAGAFAINEEFLSGANITVKEEESGMSTKYIVNIIYNKKSYQLTGEVGSANLMQVYVQEKLAEQQYKA